MNPEIIITIVNENKYGQSFVKSKSVVTANIVNPNVITVTVPRAINTESVVYIEESIPTHNPSDAVNRESNI
jgi:hypothetical protein